MKTRFNMSRVLQTLRTLAVGVVFLAVVIVLLAWLAGGFKEKIDATAQRSREQPRYTGPTAAAKHVMLPRTEEAVGSVRPVHEMVVTSRIAARITELTLTAGQNVARGDVLVRLDARDLQARVDQLKAALASAKATYNQAQVDHAQYAAGFARGAVSKLEFDRADLAMKNAEAEVTRVTESINEAQAALEYTTIRAPGNGVVVDKRVNVGDTVMPGQVLATLYDPTHMQLIASVREMLTQRLKVGQSINVRMEALGRTCPGSVSEIVPEAESASRTFQVKVTGPCPPGIYSGMFGRIIIPLDSQEVLLLPTAAVGHVGQLDLVDVVQEGRLERRIVRLGREIGGDVEILSGLREGEQVALRTSATASAPAASEGVR